LATVVAGGVAVVVALRSVFSPEPLLVEARTLLDPVAEEKDPENQAAAGQAELLLRKYLKRGGRHRDSARLLLGCAVLVQQAGSQAKTIQDQKEVGDLVDTVDPEQCPVEDLLLGTRVLSKVGRLASADRMIAAALVKGELRDQAVRLAAELRLLLGRDDEVIESCRELNELRPDDPFPLVTMSSVYEKRGHADQLVKVQRKLIDLKPPDVAEVRRRLIMNLVTVGQKQEARAEFDRLRREVPETLAAAPVVEARLLHLEGRLDEALRIAQRLVEEKPDADALLLAGRILLAQSRAQEAIPLLERLAKSDPTQEEAEYLLGQAHSRLGDAQKAKQHFDRHRRLLDLKIKLYDLERRAARDPNNAWILAELVKLYTELGWPERARFWRRVSQR
jgi:tetratricopeptide (TPR) repeat protein